MYHMFLPSYQYQTPFFFFFFFFNLLSQPNLSRHSLQKALCGPLARASMDLIAECGAAESRAMSKSDEGKIKKKYTYGRLQTPVP